MNSFHSQSMLQRVYAPSHISNGALIAEAAQVHLVLAPASYNNITLSEPTV